MSESNSQENPEKPVETEVNLDDDMADSPKDFNGASLALDNSKSASEEPKVEFKGTPSTTMPELSQEGGGLERNRPFSASMRSTTSTKSITSLNPHAVQTTYSARTYFSYRQGAFETAVEHAERLAVKKELDGDLRGAWLLNEIDHWDNEREKVVMLTDNALLVCRYDFIAAKLIEHRRVLLHGIDTLMNGDFVYPEKSLMPARSHGGVKISWQRDVPLTFGQKWNPWCTDIPYLMFAHHPIIYYEKEKETVTYNVDDFFESLVQAVNQVYRVKHPGKTVTVQEGPILIETYASISSQIFNQSSLGFFKERGGVSF